MVKQRSKRQKKIQRLRGKSVGRLGLKKNRVRLCFKIHHQVASQRPPTLLSMELLIHVIKRTPNKDGIFEQHIVCGALVD